MEIYGVSGTKDMKLPISVIVLTYNEENNIKDCIESVSDWADEIFIVDSFSNDATIEIAKGYTDKIYQHEFLTHTAQWNWALKTLPFSFEWCLALDADQIVSKELKNELKEIFRSLPLGVSGYYIKRKQIFRGKWIRFGGHYPKYLLKLFKVKEAFCNEAELVDHRFYISGKTLKLKNDIIEENINENDISFWVEKHNRYARLLAMEMESGALNKSAKPHLFGTPDQKVFWFKAVYNKLPLYIRPFLYFWWRYFICLGFLDGKEGFVFHFFQGLWYRLLVDAKIDELRRRRRRLDLKPE